jgi:hypothetical protein
LGGDQENQSEGFGTLGFALLAAIILVYLVMDYTIVLRTHLWSYLPFRSPLLSFISSWP